MGLQIVCLFCVVAVLGRLQTQEIPAKLQDQDSRKDEILEINNRLISKDDIKSSFLMEGDIIRKKSKSPFTPSVRKWPKINNNAVIPYILSDLYEPHHRTIIMDAFSDLQASTCILFVMRTNERDYISIEPAMGCFSTVGRVGGMQLVSLAFDCLTSSKAKGVVLHELMHVAGFWHEHSRADRNDYIDIAWDEIASGYEQNFCMYETSNMIVKYDLKSILHYSRYAFSKSGQPTINPKTPFLDTEIGQRLRLSPNDIQRVNKFYSCPQYVPSAADNVVLPRFVYSCNQDFKEPVALAVLANVAEGSVQTLRSIISPINLSETVGSLISTENGLMQSVKPVTSSQHGLALGSGTDNNFNINWTVLTSQPLGDLPSALYGSVLSPEPTGDLGNKHRSTLNPATSEIFTGSLEPVFSQQIPANTFPQQLANESMLNITPTPMVPLKQWSTKQSMFSPDQVSSENVTLLFTLSQNKSSPIPERSSTKMFVSSPVAYTLPSKQGSTEETLLLNSIKHHNSTPFPNFSLKNLFMPSVHPDKKAAGTLGSSSEEVTKARTACMGSTCKDYTTLPTITETKLSTGSSHENLTVMNVFGEFETESPGQLPNEQISSKPIITAVLETLENHNTSALLDTTSETTHMTMHNALTEPLQPSSILVQSTGISKHTAVMPSLINETPSEQSAYQSLVSDSEESGEENRSEEHSGVLLNAYLQQDSAWNDLTNEMEVDIKKDMLKIVGKRSLSEPTYALTSNSLNNYKSLTFPEWLHVMQVRERTMAPTASHISKTNKWLIHLGETPNNANDKSARFQKRRISESKANPHPQKTPFAQNMSRVDTSDLFLQQNIGKSSPVYLRPIHEETLPQITLGSNRELYPQQVCRFEQGFCGWNQSMADDLDWILTEGKQGPSNEHHYFMDKPKGVHMLLESVSRESSTGQRALLLSPIIQASDCISFWYGSLHHIIGTLKLYIRPARLWGEWYLLWSAGEQTRTRWTKMQIALRFPYLHRDIQLAVEGIVKPSGGSTIVIDNLYVGQCQ